MVHTQTCIDVVSTLQLTNLRDIYMMQTTLLDALCEVYLVSIAFTTVFLFYKTALRSDN